MQLKYLVRIISRRTSHITALLSCFRCILSFCTYDMTPFYWVFDMWKHVQILFLLPQTTFLMLVWSLTTFENFRFFVHSSSMLLLYSCRIAWVVRKYLVWHQHTSYLMCFDGHTTKNIGVILQNKEITHLNVLFPRGKRLEPSR